MKTKKVICRSMLGLGVFALACGWIASAAGISGASLHLVQDTTPYQSTTESPRLYDPDRAGTLRGTIVNVETVRPSAQSSPFVQVGLKVGHTVVPVHLGPQWFMDDQGADIELKQGSELEVTGTPNVVAGKRVFVALEIKRPTAEKRLRLRHEDGTPVWTGSERAS